MTLFIACLLIYAFGLSPWLYLAAFAVWGASLWMRLQWAETLRKS